MNSHFILQLSGRECAANVCRSAGFAFVCFWFIVSPKAYAQPVPKSSTCATLLDHPSVHKNTALLRHVSYKIIDTSRAQRMHIPEVPAPTRQALGDVMTQYTQQSQALTILSTDLPRDVSLVDFTCAIGTHLKRPQHETLVVVSPVGLHAWSGALPYKELRALARTHNPTLSHDPTRAAVGLSEDILNVIEKHRRMRWSFFFAALLSLCFAAGVLLKLLRTPTSPQES